MPKRYRCPICGYVGLHRPAYNGPPDEPSSASLEYCLCCNFQFGFHDDAVGISFSQWRNEWIAEGMKWRGTGRGAPRGYNPVEQLTHVDKTLERHVYGDEDFAPHQYSRPN